MFEQLLNLVIPQAQAATPTGAASQGSSSLSFVVMLVVFFIFIYFAVWRPQSKRAKEQQNLLGSLAKDDEVIIAGGMLGRISKIEGNYLTLSIANSL